MKDENSFDKAFNEINYHLNKLQDIQNALVFADYEDWEYLVSKLGDGGRDKFWKVQIQELRMALAK
jgi:hypothetical protein